MDVSNTSSFLFDFPHDLVTSVPVSRPARPLKPPMAFRTRSNMSSGRPPTPISPQRDNVSPHFEARSSPSSSPRRSVSGMRKLMPLKLSSPPASAQASPVTESSIFRSPSARQLAPRDATPVPWMNSSISTPNIGHVNPKKYRETPVYSEPNSPQLVRAYFRNTDTECLCGLPQHLCENMCVMKSFTDKLNGSDETLERFTDCLESLDGDSDSESEDGGSVSTAPTSLPSARYSGSSELSIKCRGLPSMNNGSSYIRTSVIPSLAEPFDPASPRIASSIDLQNWIESRESRCMSPGTEIEILDALATPLALAPARAQIVKVSSPEKESHSFPPRISSLSPVTKTITPPGWASRQMNAFNPQPSTPDNKTTTLLRKNSTLRRRKARPAPLDIKKPSKEAPTTTPTPKLPVTPLLSPFQEVLNYTKSNVPRYKFEVHDVAEEILCIPLIESICDTIDGSPRDLQVDSYCIAEIRRLNRQARVAAFPAPPPIPTSHDIFTADEPKRGRRSKSIFGTFRTPRANHFPVSADVPSEPRLSTTSRPSTAKSVVDTKPDLTVLRSIFPNSDDWWRSVLYAHLVAYTYVAQHKAARSASEGPQRRPSKATRTLGLPMTADLPGQVVSSPVKEDKDLMESFDLILTALASCISRIIAVMRGAENCDRAGSSFAAYERRREEIDWPFVRALSEIVKVAELGAGVYA